MIPILLEICRASYSGAKHTYIVFSPSALIRVLTLAHQYHRVSSQPICSGACWPWHPQWAQMWCLVFFLADPVVRGTWWWCSVQASFFWAFLRGFLYFLLNHGVLGHQKVGVLQIFYLWLWTPLNAVFLAFKTFAWKRQGLSSLLLAPSWWKGMLFIWKVRLWVLGRWFHWQKACRSTNLTAWV